MERSYRGVPWSKTLATDLLDCDSSRIAWLAARSSCEGRAPNLGFNLLVEGRGLRGTRRRRQDSPIDFQKFRNRILPGQLGFHSLASQQTHRLPARWVVHKLRNGSSEFEFVV